MQVLISGFRSLIALVLSLSLSLSLSGLLAALSLQALLFVFAETQRCNQGPARRRGGKGSSQTLLLWLFLARDTATFRKRKQGTNFAAPHRVAPDVVPMSDVVWLACGCAVFGISDQS